MEPSKRQRILQYMLANLQEPSTWRGIVAIATGLGVAFKPEQSEAIVAGGMMLAGLIGVLFTDNGMKK